MEFARYYLPMECEERWIKEKERKRKAIEEGGEEVKADDRKLKWMVNYNNQQMGMRVDGSKEKLEIMNMNDCSSRQEGSAEEGSDNRIRGQEHAEKPYTYCRKTYPRQVFKSLVHFRESYLLTDLGLSTEDGQCLSAHSSVLAAVSSLVQRRLPRWDEEMDISRERRDVDIQPEISISLGPEVGSEGLAGVLEFAYTGTITALNRETLAQIKAAAKTFPRVLELCCKEEERMNKEEEKAENKVSEDEQMKLSLQSIRQLWNRRVGCDLELVVDGVAFHVHKALMAASSDYFRGMFTSGMKESQQPCVHLPFLEASELDALIGCSYSGCLTLSWGSVFEITCTALQLQFQPALSLCLDFMVQEMETKTCLDVASFAEAYGLPELLEAANDFVLRNFQEVSSNLKFLDLTAEKLLEYLVCDGLCVPSELTVFRAVVAWLEADPEERLPRAPEVMTGVRFPLMTFKEFREVRAINLRLECSSNIEIDLYGSALKEFGFNLPETKDQCRTRRPKNTLVLVGGNQLDSDVGNRLASRQLWFANSIHSGTGLVKSVEWRILGEIPEKPRFRHDVGVMGGQLYVVGGCEFYLRGDMLKSTYRYDPMQDLWQRLSDMHECRSNFVLVVRSNCLYAIGGDMDINANMCSVEVYSPVSDTWRLNQEINRCHYMLVFSKPLDQALSGHAATVWNGQIFISGGYNSSYQCLNTMFMYHPDRGTTYLADMSQDRAQHCMEVLHGGLCVAGGVCNQLTFYTDQLACEVYNYLSNTWRAFTPLAIPHVGAASAVLEEKLYVLGGYSQEDYRETRLVHRYDPTLRRWENVGVMPGPNTDIRACLLHLPKQFCCGHIR
ncbi:hypothetical protein DPEC_G00095430 [Dallia pectoralis]|uniref:Uncharacterized protein n=1 Tax=Dallia pectoralis TaxID=75939 RepID=A0ACC2GVJ5_DALPE|nr:hypothetical protein DPEC_G00095430 [Dallia pectoralis]